MLCYAYNLMLPSKDIWGVYLLPFCVLTKLLPVKEYASQRALEIKYWFFLLDVWLIFQHLLSPDSE